ncbi:MAG: beta-glucosidase, partial [Chitinophagaceae bacterium]
NNTGAADISQKNAVKISDMESGEGFDRIGLGLLGDQMKLLKAVRATGKPLVLVMIQGRPLDLNWAAENVPAIINAWYPGQEGGTGIADVLFGDYNPAGRLTVSIPKSVGQLPVYYNYKRPVRRAYVEMESTPLYPFGFGLSYSTFSYDKLTAGLVEAADDFKVDVKVAVTNTSNVAGDEVVQLYVRDDYSSVVTPDRQLKKYARVHFNGKQQQTVSFTLTKEDLKLLGADMKWKTEAGRFTILVGGSSADIKLQESLELKKDY